MKQLFSENRLNLSKGDFKMQKDMKCKISLRLQQMQNKTVAEISKNVFYSEYAIECYQCNEMDNHFKVLRIECIKFFLIQI